jgi:hypothetical protein
MQVVQAEKGKHKHQPGQQAVTKALDLRHNRNYLECGLEREQPAQ